MLNTSSLLPEFKYELQPQLSKVNKICQLKVTEAFHRAIKIYIESSSKNKSLLVRKTNNKLCFVFKCETKKDVVFNLSACELNYCLSTFKLSRNILADIGTIQHKLQVQGNSDAFKSTKMKVETAEAEAKRVRTKELNFHQRKNIKCSKTIRSNQHLKSTTTNSISNIRKGFGSIRLNSVKPKSTRPSINLLSDHKRSICKDKLNSNEAGSSSDYPAKKLKLSFELPNSSTANIRIQPFVSEVVQNINLMKQHIAQILVVMPRRRKLLLEKLRNLKQTTWSFTDKKHRDWLNKCVETVCEYNPKTQKYSLKVEYFSLVKADWPEYTEQTTCVVKSILSKHSLKEKISCDRNKLNNCNLKPENLLSKSISQKQKPSTDFLTQNFGDFLKSNKNSSLVKNASMEEKLSKMKISLKQPHEKNIDYTNKNEIINSSDNKNTIRSNYPLDILIPELKDQQTKPTIESKNESSNVHTIKKSNFSSLKSNKAVDENKKVTSTISNRRDDKPLENVSNQNEKNPKLQSSKSRSKQNLENKEEWLAHLKMDQNYLKEFVKIESNDQYERYKVWFNENYQIYVGYFEEYTKVIADIDEKSKEWRERRKRVC